jgi:hypothetical protein
VLNKLRGMCSYTGTAERWEYEMNLLNDQEIFKIEKKDGKG